MKTAITNGIKRVGFTVKKYSPEALMVAGIVGTVTSTVMICRAQTKAEEIMKENHQAIVNVHDVANDPAFADQYTEADFRKDKFIVYTRTASQLIKLYAPAVTLGILSVGSILASNNIHRRRNVAIAAAYTAVDKSFKEYRGRVVERLGEEVENEIRHGMKLEKFDTEVEGKDGKKKKGKEEVLVMDETSDYARFFDETSSAWERNAEYNLMFLRSQQSYANDLLRAKGYLYLNTVYDMLGIEESKAGQIVGWVYDPENPNGDNYVTFGIQDVNRQRVSDFVNGYERSILLDFNVDGNILDLMESQIQKKKRG